MVVTLNIYIYTLLYELASNIASYCTSGRGIFTSRRQVKMQPMHLHSGAEKPGNEARNL